MCMRFTHAGLACRQTGRLTFRAQLASFTASLCLLVRRGGSGKRDGSPGPDDDGDFLTAIEFGARETDQRKWRNALHGSVDETRPASSPSSRFHATRQKPHTSIMPPSVPTPRNDGGKQAEARRRPSKESPSTYERCRRSAAFRY